MIKPTLLALAFAASSAEAATILVNTTVDVVDPYDGHCSLREAIKAANSNWPPPGTDGECLPGSGPGDVIIFTNHFASPDVYKLTTPPTGPNNANSGDLNITESVTISGNGQWETIINGGGVDRVFSIESQPGITVDVIGVTIEHGYAPIGAGIRKLGGTLTIELSTIRRNVAFCDNYCSAEGGGLSNLQGPVIIRNSTITENSAICQSGGCLAVGGGLRNMTALGLDPATIELFNTLVSANRAECEGEACKARGGGMWTLGEATSELTAFYENETSCSGDVCRSQGGGLFARSGITSLISSTVLENTAICYSYSCRASGGGLFNQSGDDGAMSIIASRVSKNAAKGFHSNAHTEGGGVFNDDASSVTISQSTISENLSQAPTAVLGGGLYNSGLATVSHSTLSENRAFGQSQTMGGGIFNGIHSSLDVVNSTFSGNVAHCQAHACITDGGGLANIGFADVVFATFFNNSVACNDRDCVNAKGGGIYNSGNVEIKHSIVVHVAGVPGEDCAGHINGIVPSAFNFDSDNTCPSPFVTEFKPYWLGPLADNGGPTQTHALSAGATYINVAYDCNDLLGAPVAADQRGMARPQEHACDVGAYERPYATPASADELSRALLRLRER